MERLVRSVKRQLRRANRVEKFVRLIVGGGVALVAGLWIATLSNLWSLPWSFGLGLAFLGIGGLVGGLWTEID